MSKLNDQGCQSNYIEIFATPGNTQYLRGQNTRDDASGNSDSTRGERQGYVAYHNKLPKPAREAEDMGSIATVIDVKGPLHCHISTFEGWTIP